MTDLDPAIETPTNDPPQAGTDTNPPPVNTEPAPDPAPPPAADTEPSDPPKAETTEEDAPKGDWPDDWRERMAGDDEDALKLIKRYGSPKGVAKALKEAQALIRSGKLKKDMPDPSDEKAMAEWRKEQGIPDDPTGYQLPETVTKRMTDEDKPMLASFTEYAHKKGAPQQVVDIASEWYFDTIEAMEAKRAADDAAAKEACEDALRKDWAHGEYKANLMLAKRYLDTLPGGFEEWAATRLPDGRLQGSVPEKIAWAADMGRERFGDATFASSDAESRHTSRLQEIENIMKTDYPRYLHDGLNVEHLKLLELEAKRRK